MKLFRKASETGPGVYRQSLGQAQWTRRDYAHLSDEAYVKNVIGYSCVRKIATAVARLPLQVFETENKETEIENAPILDLLRRPNSKQSQKELLESFVSFFELSGNGYMEATEVGGTVKELHVLRPDRMSGKLDPRGEVSQWIYKVGNFTHVFDQANVSFKQDPIMHLKKFHPTDDIYGLSSIEPAAYSIDLHNQADKFNKSLLDNSAVPTGMFTWKKQDEGVSPERFKSFAEKVKEKFSGPWSTGEPIVTGGDWDYTQLGLSVEDMALVETKRDAARDAATSWNVPPMLLGIPGDNTYSNYQEAIKAFYRDAVIPTADTVFEKISIFLSPTFGMFYLTYDEDKLGALAVERALLWDQVGKATFMTVNEKRNKVGLEDIEGGDVLLIPSGVIPLEDLSLEPIPGGPEPVDDKSGNPFLRSVK